MSPTARCRPTTRSRASGRRGFPRPAGSATKRSPRSSSAACTARPWRRGVSDAPGCTDCHGEHRILSHADSGSPVFATNVPSETCGRCHGDLRLTEKYGMKSTRLGLPGQLPRPRRCAPGERHGRQLRLLPRRARHPAVQRPALARQPGQPRRDLRRAATPAPASASRSAPCTCSPAATKSGTRRYWIGVVYLWLIALVIGGMLLHNLADILTKARSRDAPTTPPTTAGAGAHAARAALAARPADAELPGAGVQRLRADATRKLVGRAAAAMGGDVAGAAGSSIASRGVMLVVSVVWHVGGLLLSPRHAALHARHVVDPGRRAPRVRDDRATSPAAAPSAREPPRSATSRRPSTGPSCGASFVMAARASCCGSTTRRCSYLPKWITDVATAIHF